MKLNRINSAIGITIASLYHFSRMNDLKDKQTYLLALCKEQGVKGTILLAKEGINGTIAGSDMAIEVILSCIRRWPEIDNLEVKYATSSNQKFNRLKVKNKKEIVTMGEIDIDPRVNAGQHIDPKDWNDLITRGDVMLIDTRNKFEISMGRFIDAVDPRIENFREFPSWANELASRPDKPDKIAMYCTGGIRCEKATAYMKKLGFEEVYHLKGGILKYLESVSQEDSLWEGECFVFDDRVSLTHGLVEGEYSLCYGCQQPVSLPETKSSLYEQGVCCQKCHKNLSDDRKSSLRERQRQVSLARLRGKTHIGDQAMDDQMVKRKK